MGAPTERRTALKPRSISASACMVVMVLMLRCDQVCVPTVWPWRATSWASAGSAIARRPTMKKVALVQ